MWPVEKASAGLNPQPTAAKHELSEQPACIDILSMSPPIVAANTRCTVPIWRAMRAKATAIAFREFFRGVLPSITRAL